MGGGAFIESKKTRPQIAQTLDQTRPGVPSGTVADIFIYSHFGSSLNSRLSGCWFGWGARAHVCVAQVATLSTYILLHLSSLLHTTTSVVLASGL